MQILERVPHDTSAFTQGLEVAEGVLYESTGLYGQSSLRALDPATGAVASSVELADDLFGEGLTVVGDRIIQLTWKSGRALVYDRATLEPLGEHDYEGEGWGLCRMGDDLWMSDGSDKLSRRHPVSFELIERVAVTAPFPVSNLNELECVEGLVIANIWLTDNLVVIDPGRYTPGGAPARGDTTLTVTRSAPTRNSYTPGGAPARGDTPEAYEGTPEGAEGAAESGRARAVAVIDARRLVEDARRDTGREVLNGVAQAGSGTLWLTGKNWPYLYRVRLTAN